MDDRISREGYGSALSTMVYIRIELRKEKATIKREKDGIGILGDSFLIVASKRHADKGITRACLVIRCTPAARCILGLGSHGSFQTMNCGVSELDRLEWDELFEQASSLILFFCFLTNIILKRLFSLWHISKVRMVWWLQTLQKGGSI